MTNVILLKHQAKRNSIEFSNERIQFRDNQETHVPIRQIIIISFENKLYNNLIC